MPIVSYGGFSINVDASQITRMSNIFGAAAKKLPQTQIRSLKHVGDKAVTVMRRETAAQAGLKYQVLKRAVKGSVSGGQSYTIRSQGGNIRLKFFRARETRKGVVAYPRNKKTTYLGVFIKGGRFPKRVALGMGGATLQRVGKGRLPIKGIRSGVFIPDEMITGGSAAGFYATVAAEYPKRLERDLYRLLGAL